MNIFSENEAQSLQPATFLPLPLFTNSLRDSPGCSLKKCCKKYKKGKRCKSCPDR
ncbi:hypothetical protein [uncultured Fibrella sp.]|uniref:hypothetical protein n=1 Tax=uncultured Fibrella sp. TaxID=1284596 RepID=UPI0035C9E276